MAHLERTRLLARISWCSRVSIRTNRLTRWIGATCVYASRKTACKEKPTKLWIDWCLRKLGRGSIRYRAVIREPRLILLEPRLGIFSSGRRSGNRWIRFGSRSPSLRSIGFGFAGYTLSESVPLKKPSRVALLLGSDSLHCHVFLGRALGSH